VPCTDIKFSAAFLQKYPKARTACFDGREYEGRRYARVHVNGKLRKFTDMSVGEVMTIWVSENRTAAQELPGSTEDSWAMLPPL
jgi:hypothetical protein